MSAVDTSTCKVIARREREGLVNIGGRSHDKFKHDARPGVIIVGPQHRTLSPGVAQCIAELAGWTRGASG